MENQQLFDALQAQLKRQGLPQSYLERLLGELEDHITDLLEERSSSMGAARKLALETQEDQPQNIESRLGDPVQLAVFAADQYHSRTFWGRHPVLTFIVAPLPMLLSVLVAYGLALWAILWCFDYVNSWITDSRMDPLDHPYLQASLFALLTWSVLVLPPMASAMALCRVYRRNALSIRWPLVGCAIVASVVAISQFSWTLATGTGVGNGGTFAAGLNVSSSLHWFAVTFLPKFALAFGIGLLLVERARQQLAGARYQS